MPSIDVEFKEGYIILFYLQTLFLCTLFSLAQRVAFARFFHKSRSHDVGLLTPCVFLRSCFGVSANVLSGLSKVVD